MYAIKVPTMMDEPAVRRSVIAFPIRPVAPSSLRSKTLVRPPRMHMNWHANCQGQASIPRNVGCMLILV